MTQAQDQPTWTFWDPHQEAKTALGHLLQPLGPPIHDHDALLTVQINLVQAALGPPAPGTTYSMTPTGQGEDSMTTAMMRAAQIN